MRGLYVSKAWSLAAILSIMGLVCGAGTGPKRFQLVGFSSQAFTGNAGVLAFTAACQVDFADSRMCTSEEVLETTSLPVGLDGKAWVRPSFQPATAGASIIDVVDASGIAGTVDSGTSTCRGWSKNAIGSRRAAGLTVDAGGSFIQGFCDSPLPVSCCAFMP